MKWQKKKKNSVVKITLDCDFTESC